MPRGPRNTLAPDLILVVVSPGMAKGMSNVTTRRCSRDETVCVTAGPPAAEPPFPAAKSDAVAEAALAALAAVLEVAAPQAADTLVPLLERVLRVAALPRSAAAEEVGKSGYRSSARMHMFSCRCRGVMSQDPFQVPSCWAMRTNMTRMLLASWRCPACKGLQTTKQRFNRCGAAGCGHWRRRCRASSSARPLQRLRCRQRSMRRWSGTWPPSCCRSAVLLACDCLAAYLPLQGTRGIDDKL